MKRIIPIVLISAIMVLGIILMAMFGPVLARRLPIQWPFNQSLITQPFPFNHKIHLDEADCDECHRFVFTRATPEIPKLKTCMECHEEDIEDGESPFNKLRPYVDKREEIPWIRMYKLPHHVYFSHKRHAKLAKVECKICHGNIGESLWPPTRPIKATLDMDNCMNCHKQKVVTNDCVACHR